MTRSFLVSVAALVAAAPCARLAAQEPTPGVDRVGFIVAVVGDSAILNFDIQEGVIARSAALRQQPPDPGSPQFAQAASIVLEDRIAELLVLQAAARDTTIQVPDDAVNRLVQRQIEQDQRNLGGAAALEQALRQSGMSLQDYRQRLATQAKKRELIQQYQRKLAQERRPPPVTEQELRAAFEARRSQLPQREASITFQQIVVRTQPSEAAMARARTRADSVFGLVRAGQDFAQLARRFSDDVTRENGGDLGFIRRNEVVREFANAAFSLRPGDVSGPVRTAYGYHLIKVERVRGAEVQARHILFRPELSDADASSARARADTVAEQLRANADPAELWRRYGDPDTPLRGGPAPVDTLQSMLGIDLSNVTPGTVLGPVPLGGQGVASEFMVIRVLEREAPREWRLDDPQMSWLREEIAQQKLLEEVVEELRRSTHVEIRSS